MICAGVVGVGVHKFVWVFSVLHGGAWMCVGVCRCMWVNATYAGLGHIWFQSNLVNFEIPHGLMIILGSS